MQHLAQIALEKLEGLPLRQWARSGSMPMLGFGTLHAVPRLRGDGTRQGLEFALHIQCAWRFCDTTQVLVGSQDVYYPADVSETEPSPEGFMWDAPGANRCDRFFDSFMKAHLEEPITVVSAVVDSAGGFKMSFSGDYHIDVFPDIGSGDEVWRLFRPGYPGHFVMKADGTVANALT